MKISSFIIAATSGLCFGLLALLPATASAAAFDRNLSYGMRGSDVLSLQQFLSLQGQYSGPITGNFFSLTLASVKTFQAAHNITPVSGYFGPVTRAAANAILASAAPVPAATTGGTQVSDNTVSAAPVLSSTGATTTDPAVLQARISSIFDQVWALQKKINEQKKGWSSVPATSTPPTSPSTTPPTTTIIPPIVSSTTSSGASTTPPVVAVPFSTSTPQTPAVSLLWGAYVGDKSGALSDFETLVGAKTKIYADFEGWDASFPQYLSSTVGSAGKILIVFWEPSFGYDSIISGSQDVYIRQFAAAAKTYGYPVILAPFDEMNLNENAWGYGMNGNTAAKFVTAWKRMHDIFVGAGASNVRFALTFNGDSVPNVSGNQYSDYYPGDGYVDYIGLDGFNFGTPWLSFAQIFDGPIRLASAFNKPIYIMSTGSVPGTAKAAWIADGLGLRVKSYPNVLGWVWFNQNGADGNWLVNSDSSALAAFKQVVAQ